MTKIYTKLDMNENEYRIWRTDSGPCLVELLRADIDNRFFTISLCQTALEAIKKVDRLIEESDQRFLDMERSA